MVNLPFLRRFVLSAGSRALLAGFGAGLAGTIVGCGSAPGPGANAASGGGESTAAATAAAGEQAVSAAEPQIRAFCGGCHALPSPLSFPRDDWYHEVQRGFDFYFQSERRDLQPPVQAEVVRWYQSQAPEKLQLPDLSATTSPRGFTRREIAADGKTVDASVAVSFVGAL
ncbi:MAG: hypothetical protein ACKPJJ_13360, partial [Planctomycetaceae bacterium]